MCWASARIVRETKASKLPGSSRAANSSFNCLLNPSQKIPWRVSCSQNTELVRVIGYVPGSLPEVPQLLCWISARILVIKNLVKLGNILDIWGVVEIVSDCWWKTRVHWRWNFLHLSSCPSNAFRSEVCNSQMVRARHGPWEPNLPQETHKHRHIHRRTEIGRDWHDTEGMGNREHREREEEGGLLTELLF